MTWSLFGFSIVRTRELERVRMQLAAQLEPPEPGAAPAPGPQPEILPPPMPTTPAPAVLAETGPPLTPAASSPAPVPVPAVPTPAPSVPKPDVEKPPLIVSELIHVADRLEDLTGAAAPADAEQAALALRWLSRRARELLAVCDTVRFEDAGRVDSHRQTVVATRPAPTEPQVDEIAVTVRPGYLWRDRLLRPQQVIGYIAAESDAAP